MQDDLERFVEDLLRGLDLPDEISVDVREALVAHLREDVAARIGAGASRERALGEAKASLGTGDELRRQLRKAASAYRGRPPVRSTILATRAPAMSSLTADARQAVRMVLRSPGFALTVVSTLALGIGGTTAAFGLVHAVLLQPLPYPDPGRLYEVQTARSDGGSWDFSVADYMALVEQQTTLEGVAIYDPGTLTLNGEDFADRVAVQAVNPAYFEVLGLRPAIGRAFAPQESAPESPRVAVVSHGFWMRYLESRRDLSGAVIHFGQTGMEVVGVLPPDVGPVENGIDVYYNIRVGTPPRKGPFNLTALVRLRADVTEAQAAEELRAINERIFPIWQDSWPDATSTWALEPLESAVVGDAGNALVPLLGAIGLLLVIAATNGANLILARGVQRRRELAVRAALGASRLRLLTSVGAEGLLLATFSSTLGLALARALLAAVARYGEPYVPRLNEVGFTSPVIAAWLVVSLACALLFVLLPSAHLAGADLLAGVRRAGGRAGASQGHRKTRRALVAAQFAIAVPLLVGAGLLLGSLWQLARVDPGFDPEGLLTARVALSRSPEQGDAALGLWDEIIERVSALPGVDSAGLSTGLPPDNPAFGNNFVLEDVPLRADESQPSVPWVVAASDYFETMRIPLLEGRLFEPADLGERVAIVDRAWADRFFAGEPTVGRRFRQGGCTGEGCAWWTVIGVVGQVAYEGLGSEAAGVMYIHPSLTVPQAAYLVVRTVVPPLGVLGPLRAIVREIDDGAPVTGVATGNELLGTSLREPRYLSFLIAGFASIALLLSAVGIYGVMSYFVQDRRRDIGIRLALGGDPASVTRLVVADGMRLVTIGVGIGLVGALVTTRLLTSLLYGVRPTEPAVFAAVVLGVTACTLLACLLPARRAAGLDPTETLRED